MPRLRVEPRFSRPQREVMPLYYLGMQHAVEIFGDPGPKESQRKMGKMTGLPKLGVAPRFSRPQREVIAPILSRRCQARWRGRLPALSASCSSATRGPSVGKSWRTRSALIAQLAEHALSKRKVTSSNLVGGFRPCWCSW